MNKGISELRRSKHALIAEALSSEIQSGKYKIGDLLPSEAELSVAFGVSRHTVRIALRTLHVLGLVISHQGIGTKVHKDKVVSRYSYSFSSALDILQYAKTTGTRMMTTTKPRLIDCKEIVIDAEQSHNFGCKPGEHWWCIRTLRSEPTGASVVAYSEIHIPLAFGAVLADIAKNKQPIFALIERRFNETVVEIQQDIRAISTTPEEARFLTMPRKSPGLEITRRYIGKSGRVLEIARSVHPNESFRYSLNFLLRHGA